MSELFITLREGLEHALILLLIVAVFEESRRKLLVFAVLVTAAGVLAAVFSYPLPEFLKGVSIALLSYSFLMILLLSFIAAEGRLHPFAALVFLLFLPSAQLTVVVLDAASLKGMSALVAAASALLAVLTAFAAALRILPRLPVRDYFDRDGVYVFSASLLFLFGGVREYGNSAVVPALQNWFSSFLSSFIPHLRDVLLIPSGDLITTGFDAVTEYLVSDRMSMAASAIVLFLPPLVIFMKLLAKSEPDTAGLGKKADRRLVLFFYRRELIGKGIPVLMALLVSIILLHRANSEQRPSFNPEPVPLVTEGDRLTIPLQDRFGDIADGRIRKYSIVHQGNTYRFLVIMRPDGEVIAALDACEVCPPRGYVQRGNAVNCVYCNTPIPVQSIGQPGGCNPIPLRSSIQGDALVMSKGHIASVYQDHAGKETGSLLR